MTGPAPTTMRRVVVQDGGAIEVTTAPVPEPGEGEVLVRTLVSGVCGSDTHAAHGAHPFITLPYRPGHEVVGVVGALGAGAPAHLEVGQRVTVEPTLVCGRCKQCRAGRENLCEELGFFGCGADQGGMADWFTIAGTRLHLIPDDFTDEQAALVEPLSTPVHAVRLACAGIGDLTGRSVAIIGAGTIGLLVLAAARHFGARDVVVTDVLPAKRERACPAGCRRGRRRHRLGRGRRGAGRPRRERGRGLRLRRRSSRPSTRPSAWRSRPGRSSWSASPPAP